MANPEESVHSYDLIAVNMHSGTLGSGHYLAFTLKDELSEWYSFSDSSFHVCFAALLDAFGEHFDFQPIEKKIDARAYSDDVYMLYYRRRQSWPEVPDLSWDDGMDLQKSSSPSFHGSWSELVTFFRFFCASEVLRKEKSLDMFPL